MVAICFEERLEPDSMPNAPDGLNALCPMPPILLTQGLSIGLHHSAEHVLPHLLAGCCGAMLGLA